MVRDQGRSSRVKEMRNQPGKKERYKEKRGSRDKPLARRRYEKRATSAREETKGETACSHGGVSVAASATPDAAADAAAVAVFKQRIRAL